MQNIKQAWFIFRGDLRGEKSKLVFAALFSLLMIVYLSGLTMIIVDDFVGGKDRTIMADFIMLSMVPGLGFIFSRRTMKYWAEDSYTRMLAYLKVLPIPLEVILTKRKIQSFLSFVPNSIVYFGLMYAGGAHIRETMNGIQFVSFVLTWVGYGLVISGVYIFIEFLYSGKMYSWFAVLMMALSMGIAVIIGVSGGNVVMFTVERSKEWGLLSPVMWGMLLLGGLSIHLWGKWTLKRLKRRSFL